jgi:hypothetical protein
VPQYDPAVVYVRPSTDAVVVASLISFGVGIGIGALLVDNRPWGWGGWGWNWGSRRVYYNHVVWGDWSSPYRPPRPWYRPRPIVWSNRPGYRGDWRYRPQNYRPPHPPYNRPGYSRPPYGPGNRPGYNRPGNRPGGYRPPSQPYDPVPRAGPLRNRSVQIAHRSPVKRDRRLRVNLLQGLAPSLKVHAVHRRSRGSVSNQGRNPDRREASTNRGTSVRVPTIWMVSKKCAPPKNLDPPSVPGWSTSL